MSTMLDQNQPATYTASPGEPRQLLSDQDLQVQKRRILQAKVARRPMEPYWLLNLRFARGRQFDEWRAFNGGGRFITPNDDLAHHRYAVDKITTARQTVLGQFTQDDDRPQVLFRSDDLPTEDFADAMNDAVAAGWQTEWLGDRALEDVKRIMIDLGTSAARCMFDPTAGPARAKQVPHDEYGKPILDPGKATAYAADRHAQGASANLKSIHEGRIRWMPGTPFNLLVPPGLKREEKFPWRGWVEPVLLDRVQEQYGKPAATLKPESITDLETLGEQQPGTDTFGGTPGPLPQLADHVFQYVLHEEPSRAHPNGRVIVLAGADLRCLEVREQLDYLSPDGARRSGLHYFHYIRLTDRFWGRSLIDLMREPQKAFSKRRSQIGLTIDRGQPFILCDERMVPKRKGTPVEMVKLKQVAGAPQPVVSSGVPVGQWMYEELKQLDDDLRQASGLQDVLQGKNPSAVGNYSQLALLQEQALQQFSVTIGSFKETVAHLVEDSVYDIRRYWGRNKLLALEGPDGALKAFEFDATKIPDFYRVYVSKGASQPRSQASELKKIDDLATYSINSGQPLPLDWVKESYDSGKPIELPEASRHDQLDKALLENQLLEQGQVPQVAYYDDHALHVTVARSLQARADATGDPALSQRCEQHIRAHEQQAELNAAEQQAGISPGTTPPAQPDMGIPHPNAFSLFLRGGPGSPGNFGI